MLLGIISHFCLQKAELKPRTRLSLWGSTRFHGKESDLYKELNVYTGCSVRWVNRYEKQERNHPQILKRPFGFVFGVQLGLQQTQVLINTMKNKLLKEEQLVFVLLGLSQWLPR